VWLWSWNIWRSFTSIFPGGLNKITTKY
jgi:hypothetical protein